MKKKERQPHSHNVAVTTESHHGSERETHTEKHRERETHTEKHRERETHTEKHTDVSLVSKLKVPHSKISGMPLLSWCANVHAFLLVPQKRALQNPCFGREMCANNRYARQRVAVCCSVSQCVAVCCSPNQRYAKKCAASCCSVLQYITVCRRVLQHVAACCSVLRRVAAFCNSIRSMPGATREALTPRRRSPSPEPVLLPIIHLICVAPVNSCPPPLRMLSVSPAS